jgi:hypothetical protein
MYYRFLAVLFGVALFLGACASAPTPEPEIESEPPLWALDTRAVYPDREYIAARGEGTTKVGAEAGAVAEISFYFVRQVTAERSSRSSWTTRNNEETTASQTEENVLVESQTRLVTVRLAEDPWFNPAKKVWETVAYINRDEGWTVYEPNAKKQAAALMALVQAAETESEPFNAVLRWGITAAYADSAEFNGVRDFSQILHPEKAAALFAPADAALGELFEKQLAAVEKSRVYVECPVDYNGMIYQAMVKALGGWGFGVERSREAAAAVCEVQVEEGIQKQDSGTFYYPALTATISGGRGAIFSFKITGGREGGLNPDVAKRRAYTALAAALEKDFAGELQKRQTALAGE